MTKPPKLTGAAKRHAMQASLTTLKVETPPATAPAEPAEPKPTYNKQDAVAPDTSSLPPQDHDVPIIDSPGRTPSRVVTIDRDTVHILTFPDGHEYTLNVKDRIKSDLIVRTKGGALVRLVQVDKPTKSEQKDAEIKAFRKAARRPVKFTQSDDSTEDTDNMAKSKKSASKASKKKSIPGVSRASSFSGKKLFKLVKENPRRAGTNGYKSWEKLTSGMTWDAAVKAGARAVDLRWDITHKNLEARNA